MNWPQIFFNLFSNSIILFLLSRWISSRLENSIKHEYDKLLQDYRHNIEVRERAARVSEYLALAHFLKEDSPSDEYYRARQLSYELAIWLPADIYIKMVKSIKEGNLMQTNKVLLEVRELLLGDKQATGLTVDDIAIHAPGIGKQ